MGEARVPRAAVNKGFGEIKKGFQETERLRMGGSLK